MNGRQRGRTLKDGSLSEKAFSQMVVDLAKLCNWYCYRTWTSIHSPSGFPDLILAHPPTGRVIFAELKAEKGKTSASQDEWLNALSLCGQITEVWRPSDWSAIERVLTGGE